jgi:hypothetical protein
MLAIKRVGTQLSGLRASRQGHCVHLRSLAGSCVSEDQHTMGKYMRCQGNLSVLMKVAALCRSSLSPHPDCDAQRYAVEATETQGRSRAARRHRDIRALVFVAGREGVCLWGAKEAMRPGHQRRTLGTPWTRPKTCSQAVACGAPGSHWAALLGRRTISIC